MVIVGFDGQRTTQGYIAPILLPELEKELVHISSDSTIYRKREIDIRVTCGKILAMIRQISHRALLDPRFLRYRHVQGILAV